ncbi:MAG TPA: glycosyltransferase [Thiobacillaceae bacterium]|nr:glycosyltransferase [Thiobacillaceae bacterium]
MRVLIAHNAYQQRGGEDTVAESEVELLRHYGHEVETYTRHNDEIVGIAPHVLARQTFWSGRTTAEVDRLIRAWRPDILHVHNTFPLISPSLYWAAARAGVPVVQTLHNFRLLCPQAMFLRDGRNCEDCLGHLPWRGVARRCYRGSAAQSGVLAGMLSVHRALGTYARKVNRYIALNGFCRDKFVQGGLPAGKIAVKPNFVAWDAGRPDQASPGRDNGFLFVGRLSAEKGVDTLARACSGLNSSALRVAGTGPETERLSGLSGVTLLGALSHEEVRAEMGNALALVMPSIWYETFGLVVIEAYSCGLPVIASRLGALAELVRDGETGLLFEPGNARDLAEKMRWARANPEAMTAMGRAARAEYEAKYTPEINYRQLMAIYEAALGDESA